MAMTKAEKTEMAQLRRDLARAKALRWPEQPEPQPMDQAEIERRLRAGEGVPGRWGSPALRAWFYGESRAVPGFVDQTGHKFDATDAREGGWSQNSGRPYRTEAEALLALRWVLCREFADKLLKIEQTVERATAPSGS